MMIPTEDQIRAGIERAMAELPPLDIRDSADAFENAITSGRLTDGDSSDPLYAGRYMYMAHVNNRATFKDIVTRRYLP